MQTLGESPQLPSQMSDINFVSYEDIHTRDKREGLDHEFRKVSSEIHRRFPKLSRSSICPVCGSSDLKELLIKYGYNLDICNSCNHIFTNPMPSKESLNYFYNSPYKDFENKFFQDSRSARLKVFEYRVRELQKHLNADASVLNIGSALGLFEEVFLDHNLTHNLTAIDINKTACDWISSAFPQIKAINCDVLDYTCDCNYDLITLWDTLEHIPDASLFIAKISGLLPSHGLLAFTTPNTDSFEWWAAGLDHPQLLPPGHVNLFNKNNIGNFLRKLNYEIVFLQTPNASLDVSFVHSFYRDTPFELFSSSHFLKCLNSLTLNDEDLCLTLTHSLVRAKCAGNMFVLARKM